MDDKMIPDWSLGSIPVLVPPNHCSHGGDRWIISNTASGTISNNIALSTNCATEQLPLEIKAFPGQRINLTLYDFNTPYLSEQTMQYDASSHVRCDEFVNILDNNAKSKTKLCPGNERVKHGYLSTNDSLLVYFKRIPSAQKSKRFLLEFEGKTCPASPLVYNTAINSNGRGSLAKMHTNSPKWPYWFHYIGPLGAVLASPVKEI